MALRRNTWLPKFDPSADFIVVRPNEPIAGRQYSQDEPFDKKSVDKHKLRKMYEARIIAPVMSADLETRLNRDSRRHDRGKRIVETATFTGSPAPKQVETVGNYVLDGVSYEEMPIDPNGQPAFDEEGAPNPDFDLEAFKREHEAKANDEEKASEEDKLSEEEKERAAYDAAKQEASSLGIDVDGRWGVARIIEEIEAFKLQEKKKARRRERAAEKGKKKGK